MHRLCSAPSRSCVVVQPQLQQPQQERHFGSNRAKGGVERARGGSGAPSLLPARHTGQDGTFIRSNLVRLPHTVTAVAPLISSIQQRIHRNGMWQCWRDGVTLLTPPCLQHARFQYIISLYIYQFIYCTRLQRAFLFFDY